MTDPQTANSPFAMPIHHLGYVVDDLERAIHEYVTRLGAGPFFLLRDVPLTVTSSGEPGVFAHSSAFGQWGSVAIELMQIERCEPARVADAMGQSPSQLNHIAFALPALDTGVSAIEEMGSKSFLRASLGDIEFSMHDARSLCGHNIELHQDSEGLRGFYRQIREASVGWDGSDPIRQPQM